MRTGTSLVGNILTVHPKIQVFSEKVHFFRFVYNKYDPMDIENAERALRHMQLRWRYRFGIALDVDTIMGNLIAKELSYGVVYEEIMRCLCNRTDAEIWTENVAVQWRYIPQFLNMFPNGKAIHIYRDIRGVLASWREMTFSPNNQFLNAIFNWVDSINCMQRYKDILCSSRYLPVRFEDIHADPQATCQRICTFLGIEFEALMLEPERWAESFNKDFVEANTSSHTRKKVYGFDSKRGEKWREVLFPWEVATAEFLANKQMSFSGYEPSMDSYDSEDIQQGFDKLLADPFLLKNLQLFQATGEGNDLMPSDPTDPMNWASPDGYGKFSESKDFKEYQRDMERVEQIIASKR